MTDNTLKIFGTPIPDILSVKHRNSKIKQFKYQSLVSGSTFCFPNVVSNNLVGIIKSFAKSKKSIYKIVVNVQVKGTPTYKITVRVQVWPRALNAQYKYNIKINGTTVEESESIHIIRQYDPILKTYDIHIRVNPEKESKLQHVEFIINNDNDPPKFRMRWVIDPELIGKISKKFPLSLTVNRFQPSLTTNKSDDLFLNIVWHSDELGSNLGEIVCIVEGDYLPQDKYPTKLIGKYSWFNLCNDNLSYFSKHPNFMKVMKRLPTKTYYQKAQEHNKLTKLKTTSSHTSLTTTIFYENLLSFMSARYFLGGLSSGCLSTKWLLQSNTKKLYKNILRSCFAKFITLLTETYKGYDLYMRIC